MTRIRTALTAAALTTLALAGPASAAAVTAATARFVPGSGVYLRGVDRTDGLSRVGGWVQFRQPTAGATITVTGRLTGLRPLTRYVAVLYRDGICAPIAGVTAYPSGSFMTNSTGMARMTTGVTVNPRAINPVGAVNVGDAHSVSIRRVILTPVPLPVAPGYPTGVSAGTPVAPAQTPTVPNLAAVEGCDRGIVLS